jgi:hypothetical protein
MTMRAQPRSLPEDPVPPDAPAKLPPDERPTGGPTNPRKPYPVDDPAIGDPDLQPGVEPDVFPGQPANPLPRF